MMNKNQQMTLLEGIRKILSKRFPGIVKDRDNNEFLWKEGNAQIGFGFNRYILKSDDGNEEAMFVELLQFQQDVDLRFIEKVKLKEENIISKCDKIEFGTYYKYVPTKENREEKFEPAVSLIQRIDENQTEENIAKHINEFRSLFFKV